MIRYRAFAALLAIVFVASVGGGARAQFAAQQTYVASSSGTNAYSIILPNVRSLADLVGVPIPVLMSASNTSSVTLTVNTLATTAVEKPTTVGLAALVGGEIVAGQISTFMYDTNGVFELVQPNLNISTIASTNGYVAPVNMDLSCSVAANALTCAVLANNTGGNPSATAPVWIPFRDPTIANGDVVWREITSALSFTISGGNTMGMVNGQTGHLWYYFIDNAGSVGLCAYNTLSGSNIVDLPESQLQTSASGTGGGSSAQTLYCSISSVTSKAVRRAGYIEVSETTAGTWAVGPTKVQPFGPGVSKPGDVIQHFYTQSQTGGTGTVTAYTLSTSSPPTTGNGYAIVSQAITPFSAADIIRVHGKPLFTLDASNTAYTIAFLYNGSSVLQSDIGYSQGAGGNTIYPLEFVFDWSGIAGSTSPITYTLYGGGDGTTLVKNEMYNAASTGNWVGGTLTSWIDVEEIME